MVAPSEPRSPAAGLTAGEAADRLARQGPNLLPAARGHSIAHQLVVQLVHFFALMLWMAGLLAFVAGMPQLGVAIFGVIIINGAFAFLQEHRAERAAARLRALLPLRATVIRDGARLEVDAATLVDGDVVLLAAGDRVCADLRLTTADGLAIDASTLTGESVPVELAAGDEASAGTFVVAGEGSGIVTATGARTRLGGIARLTQAGRRPASPLARELGRVVRVVAIMAVGVGVAFFGVALLVGTPPGDGFIFAVGVTVALVPEGLLPTVTLSLAMGAQRMAERHALVRRLESVETLGSTTFICTDKTGTLTRNEMEVVRAWTPMGGASITGGGYGPDARMEAETAARPDLERLAAAARTASSGRAVLKDGAWVAVGDPMEAAIDAFAARIGIEQAEPALDQRYPFDARLRRMTVVSEGRVFTKGAPETVLPLCTSVEAAADAVEAMAQRGLRVIAVAGRAAPSLPAGREAAESGLELLGLLGLEDPPREGVAAAIASCREAGIRVAMVTGDNPATARAIAREVGLLVPSIKAMTGDALPDDEQLVAALGVRDGLVVGRVTPEQKLRIARALRSRGHVVAMTGDGVNDGPALQEADVGVAMGKGGTDVARAAADLILLDDNFATIAAAVEEGRATFANIRRFLTYHLTDNVAELTPFLVWALSGGAVPLALGVLQILCLDIGTDVLPALALGSERPGPRTFGAALDGGHLIDVRVLRRVFMFLGPVEALVSMTAFFVSMAAAGWRPGDAFPEGSALLAASGATFAAVVLAQAANAFACRSTLVPPWRLGWTTNRLMLIAVAVELALLAAFLFIPPVADLLDQAGPPAVGWLVAMSAPVFVLATDWAQKRWLRAA